MNDEPTPIRNGYHNDPASDAYTDDAVEVTEAPATAPGGRPTVRLDVEPVFNAVGDAFAVPLGLLPAESREHLRNAGREASLALADLGAGLFRGLALVFSVAGEALKSYSERNSKITDINSARARRRKVDIEVE